MNLPKKLKHDPSPLWPSCVVDEKGHQVCAMNSYRFKNEIKEEIIKRYNSYNKLVISLYVVSTLLVFTASTLITLLRYKII